MMRARFSALISAIFGARVRTHLRSPFSCAARIGKLYRAIGTRKSLPEAAAASEPILTIEQPGQWKTMDNKRNAEDFARRQVNERKKYRREAQLPDRASEAILQRLNQVADRIEKGSHPIEEKRKLATYVQSRVRCPGLHRAEAEKAAAYVLEPAPGEPSLPMKVLEQLLDQLDEADRKGKVSPYVEGVGGGRGGWFVGVLKLRLREHGITQRKKGVRRT
jgi:hypothetical protein